MSSPFAAGVTALVWSAMPQASAAQIKQAIFSTADTITNGPDGYFVQYGRINPYKAFLGLSGSSIAPPTDSIAPSVSITAPSMGSMLCGAVAVNFSAIDYVGVS